MRRKPDTADGRRHTRPSAEWVVISSRRSEGKRKHWRDGLEATSGYPSATECQSPSGKGGPRMLQSR